MREILINWFSPSHSVPLMLEMLIDWCPVLQAALFIQRKSFKELEISMLLEISSVGLLFQLLHSYKCQVKGTMETRGNC